MKLTDEQFEFIKDELKAIKILAAINRGIILALAVGIALLLVR